MRHIGRLAGAALIAFIPAVASAQMGAPDGAPMQPGGWGQGGWQAGAPGTGYAPGQGYVGGGGYRGAMEHGHGNYPRLERGKRLPHAYMDQSYTVTDWSNWGFAPPGPGMRWVRYYDDGMLIDGEGRIVDARYGVDWDRGHMRGPRGGYDRGGYPGGYAGGYAGGPGYGYGAPGVTSYRAGPNTTVTTSVVQAPPPVIVGGPGYAYGGAYGGSYAGGGYYAGGASVISVTPGVAVTTTTTSTDYETIYKSVAVRRAWRRPIRRYHPRCVRTPTCAVQGS